jgi:hypothetical protein
VHGGEKLYIFNMVLKSNTKIKSVHVYPKGLLFCMAVVTVRVYGKVMGVVVLYGCCD